MIINCLLDLMRINAMFRIINEEKGGLYYLDIDYKGKSVTPRYFYIIFMGKFCWLLNFNYKCKGVFGI